ncbi:MAG TPA: thymidine phosphorylase [Thermoanaerobaculia bacterium]|jgi:pyrimidine-nucleoside phosphorylase|nr:thymidine phosphorylase [Thermoanaerobaculia bacterium]
MSGPAAVPSPYEILVRKRAGRALDRTEIRALVAGAASGSWSDSQLGAFLMAAAIRGLDRRETRELTLAMLESGERWELARALPGVVDKHSTGGVGDKVSLVLAPLLAACGLPIAMLTGRGLGHTGGTADKLESVPGLRLELDRERALGLLREVGMALGIATGGIAPADRRLYALRDVTGTVDSLPLIVASILSKKLATGAAAVVFDVKTGDAAFLPGMEQARELARLLVNTCAELGVRAAARLTDMSQPLGEWSGNAAELLETFALLEGGGPPETREVTLVLALDLAALAGVPLDRAALARALDSGRARESFVRALAAQGGDRAWLARPELPLAPHERVLLAPRSGWLGKVRTRQLGLLMVAAGAGRQRPGDAIDPGVALRYRVRLGERLETGQELARLYLRRADADLEARFAACFEIGDAPEPVPALVGEELLPEAGGAAG